MTRWKAVLAATAALALLGGSAVDVRAQDHEHITNTARRMNESFAADEEWIERFESEGREIFDFRYAIVDQLGLRPGIDVADIGAGSGLLTRLVAMRVAPDGIVYAIDISPTMIDYIAETATSMGLENVRPMLGEPATPGLPPNSVDVVMVVATYHHFELPQEMLEGIKSALRPDGLLVLVDNERIEGVTPPGILSMVRAGKGTFTDEVVNAGFELIDEVDIGMHEHYLLRFRHRPM
jgi:SAM-dependent methyltransferase